MTERESNMNKATTFIRKHLAAVLVVAIALAVPVGMASGKYTTTVNAASGISVSVTAEKTYTYSLASGIQLNKVDNSSSWTSLSFVTGNSVPSTASFVTTLSVESDSGRVGVFLDGTNAYVAPMSQTEDKPASNDSVIYANKDSSYLMYNLSATTITCTNLDTSKTTNMSYMFASCVSLKILYITSFSTAAGSVNINYMFNSDSKLTTIYASKAKWDNAKVNASSVFNGCKNLPNYSRIGDKPSAANFTDNNGYFTAA